MPVPRFLPQSDSILPAVQLQDVVKVFQNPSGEVSVLKKINLNLRTGEFVSIVGKSGSGKSTLLNMVTGIDRPTSGDVIVGGSHLHQLDESKRALWRGKTVGIVFQFFQLLPTLSLIENVMLPMDYCNVLPFEKRFERAQELLEQVGLVSQMYKHPSAVSMGQQQTAAIARALANNPPIIVADEPTGNLDTAYAEIIINLFDNLVKQGKTIVMVTHDPNLTERTMRTIVISDGELVDETVAKALPLLSHRQMMTITRQLTRLNFSPGQPILKKGQAIDFFYMIAQGTVDVVLKTREDSEVIVARLQPGEFFGEIELLSNNHTIAAVRASIDGPVGIVALPHDDFVRMLEFSPLTEQALCKIVDMRIAEHMIASGGRH